MAQMFAAFGKFGQNNKGSVQNFGIIGITVGSEELLKFIFFYCPCNYPLNQVYGSTFIWGPAAILLVVGYVINRRTWRLTTGMCNRTQGVGKGCKRMIHFIFIFINISMKAILAPATWIVIAFLKGDYYTCAAWPHPSDPGVYAKFGLAPNTSIPPPCYFKDKPTFFDRGVPESIARDLRAYSHIIGWWFLTWALLIGVFVMFIFRCLSKYSYEQSKYIQKYRAQEMALFEEGLDAKATAQAKIVVDQFFVKPRKKEEWDQIASINDKVMRSKRGRPIYSPMHKFVNRELIALELAQDDIVSDVAQKKHHLSNVIGRKKKASKWPSLTNFDEKPVPVSKTNPPPKPSSSTRPVASSIPMVAMMRPGRTVVKPPIKPVEMKEGTHASMLNQNAGQPAMSTEIRAEVAPPIPPKDVPTEGVEEDPIEEANVADRRSLILPAANMEEDPIMEATIADQADEIRTSMQNLADEATENGMEPPDYQDQDGEEDDSQPLI